MQISYWWFLGDLLLASLEDIWGHLPLVLIIFYYTFCIVIKHLELLYVLQTIIVWKEFELDSYFVFYLWNVWIFFYKYVVEINVLFKCEVWGWQTREPIPMYVLGQGPSPKKNSSSARQGRGQMGQSVIKSDTPDHFMEEDKY